MKQVGFLWNRTVAVVDKLSSTSVDFIRSERELEKLHLCMESNRLTEHAQSLLGGVNTSSLSDLMKSTEVDASLSTTTTAVLFQRKPTCFKIVKVCLIIFSLQ